LRMIRGILAIKRYIADLQGVLEATTGKFFIIDPLAVKPLSEAKTGEVFFIKTSIRNLETVVAFLSTLLFSSKALKKYTIFAWRLVGE